MGFGETYFAAYALFLGANNFQIGILSGLPIFLWGMSQFSSVALLKMLPSHRKVVCLSALLQSLSLIPLFLAYYFSFLRIELYIVIVSFFFVTNGIVAPIWTSWVADLVDLPERAGFFSKKNKLATLGTFLSMTLAGLCLRYFKRQGWELQGFALIFSLAFLCRMASFYLLSLQTAPRSIDDLSDVAKPPGFFKFVRDLRQINQGILVLYMSLVNFSVCLAAAYFTPLMLRELKFNYITYTLVVAGTLAAKFLTYSSWGKAVDKIGPRKTILISGVLISFATLPWIFTGNALYLFLAQCYGGVVLAGYEISTFTFLLDATEITDRAHVTSYLGILLSAFGLAGALIGGGLFSFDHPMINPYAIVFALSCVLKLFAIGVLGRKLKEVRIVSTIRAKDLFRSVTGFKYAMSLFRKKS
jgi:MFS family permease